VLKIFLVKQRIFSKHFSYNVVATTIYFKANKTFESAFHSPRVGRGKKYQRLYNFI